MKNDQMIDITVDRKNESELTEEEIVEQNYQTALRYIEIAKYMKKYQDQDKYYNRAIQYLKLVVPHRSNVRPMLRKLKKTKFQIRAEGMLASYKEACMIRDKAKTPSDYDSAERIFEELARYQTRHTLIEKHITPEVYSEVIQCMDSADQIKVCQQLRGEMNARARRTSFIKNIIVVACLVAALFFTRTTEFRRILGAGYAMMHDNDNAWKAYKRVFDESGDMGAYERYKSHLYKAVDDMKSEGEMETAAAYLHKLSEEDYKDSRDQLARIEIDSISRAVAGDKVSFGNMDWLVLDHTGDRVLMIKDAAMEKRIFQEKEDPVTWENSSMREYLNGEFLAENIYDEELAVMIENEVAAEDNAVYGTKAGADTKDYVYLLSPSEVEKYQEILLPTKQCWWLRTPGAKKGTMAYAYVDKSVIYYGTDAGIDQIRVKPVICVNVKK